MDWVKNLLESTSFGNVLNILGIVITLVGFAIAIKDTRKSRESAQRAERAVLQVREDIRKTNTVVEFSEALAIMDEIKRLHRNAKWIILPDRYSALKKLLVSIRSTNPDLSDKHKTDLQSAIQQITNMENQVEKSLVDVKDAPNIPALNAIVTKQIDSLREILVGIQNKIGV